MDDKKVMVEKELKRGCEAATQLRSLIVDVPSQLQTFNQRSSSSDHNDDQILINDNKKNGLYEEFFQYCSLFTRKFNFHHQNYDTIHWRFKLHLLDIVLTTGIIWFNM